MANDNLLAWMPMVIALLTAVGSAIAWLSSRGKRMADVSAVNIDVSIKLLNEMQEEVGKLRSRVTNLEDAVSVRDNRIAELESALAEEQSKRRSLEYRFIAIERERDELKAENLRLKKRGDGLG